MRPGTPYPYYVTKDGSQFYQFDYHYQQMPGYWEVYIIKQPSYEGRNSSLEMTHRLPSSQRKAKYKICITKGLEPKDLESAQQLSMDWAELTHNYIKTGKSIDAQVSDNHKPWWKKKNL